MAKEENSTGKDFFGEFTKNIRKRADKTAMQMAKIVEKEVKKNVSFTDHTLEWMRSQGHPYAKRAPNSPHGKTPIVHIQGRDFTANLSENINIFEGDKKGEYQVGVDKGDVPYISDLIHGTTKMVGRDFLAYSLKKTNKKLKKTWFKAMKKFIKKRK